jgi:hypothetical protein
VTVVEGDCVTQRHGSGVVVAPRLILTAHHVVDGCRSLVARAYDRPTLVPSAVMVAGDDAEDVAVLRTNTDVAAPIRLSQRALKPGARIYVVGAPYGLESTFVEGVVSGVRGDAEVVQIAAPVGPGSSGGAVLDEDGALAGIVLGVHPSGGASIAFIATTPLLCRALRLAEAGVAGCATRQVDAGSPASSAMSNTRARSVRAPAAALVASHASTRSGFTAPPTSAICAGALDAFADARSPVAVAVAVAPPASGWRFTTRTWTASSGTRPAAPANT